MLKLFYIKTHAMKNQESNQPQKEIQSIEQFQINRSQGNASGGAA